MCVQVLTGVNFLKMNFFSLKVCSSLYSYEIDVIPLKPGLCFVRRMDIYVTVRDRVVAYQTLHLNEIP